MVAKLFSNRSDVVRLFSAAFFLLFFFVSALNTSVTSENNLNAFLAEVVFFLFVALFLSGNGVLSVREVLLGAVFVFLVAFLNLIAYFQIGNYSGVERTVIFSFQVALFFLFYSMLFQYHESLKGVIYGVFVALIVSFLLIVLVWCQQPYPELYGWAKGLINFRNIRHFGYFLAFGSIFSLWLVLCCGKGGGLVSGALFSLAMGLLLWSGGRAGFIAVIAGAMVFLFFFWGRSFWWRWALALAALIFSFVVGLQFPVQDPMLGVLRLYETVPLDVVDGSLSEVNAFSSNRLEIWRQVWSLIEMRPWVGWGGDAFVAMKIYPGLVQAHNGFLQVAFEWGGVVCLLFFSALVYVFLRGFYLACRLGRERGMNRLTLGLALAGTMATLSLVDGIFYHAMPMLLTTFSFALIYAESKKTERMLRHGSGTEKSVLQLKANADFD